MAAYSKGRGLVPGLFVCRVRKSGFNGRQSLHGPRGCLPAARAAMATAAKGGFERLRVRRRRVPRRVKKRSARACPRCCVLHSGRSPAPCRVRAFWCSRLPFSKSSCRRRVRAGSAFLFLGLRWTCCARPAAWLCRTAVCGVSTGCWSVCLCRQCSRPPRRPASARSVRLSAARRPRRWVFL